MPVDSELLLKVLGSARGKPLSIEEVTMRAGLGEGSRSAVRRALRELATAGRLEVEGSRFRSIPEKAPEAAPVAGGKNSKGKGASASEGPYVPATAAMPLLPRRPREGSGLFIGTLTRHRDGYGFIAPMHGGDDLFVPPQAMGEALDGDLVEARMGPGRDERPVARQLRVVERRRRLAIGTYRAQTVGGRVTSAHVEPRDTSLGPLIEVPPDPRMADGDVVRVRLEEMAAGLARGFVSARVGLPGDPNVEVLSVAYAEGFGDVFPADTAAAAKNTPNTVRPEDKIGRRDLTGLDLVTIDGEDARDFDDAIYVERTNRGYRLVVAIADVTAYVEQGGALDREALRRATSVYFPQHVMPMLPEELSNGICSLNPKVERLCMVADLALDDAGRPLDSEIYPAVMLSKARCTYTQVAALVDGKAVPELGHVKDMVLLAAELASRMTQARMLRGAIDFDIPEGHIVLNAEGEIAAIVKRARNAAHRLVEEFMLAANEGVARYFETRALPTVYRVHGEPKEAKLEAFVALAQVFGYVIDLDAAGKVSAAVLNEFLHRVEGRPEQRALNHLLLRSMMQALYSAQNIGHFGLAAESYLHFTSPIRRYPDLIVHRLLKEHWARGGRVLPVPERERQTEELDVVAAHCSERERAATNAEREIDAFYAASLMRSHVGERFTGTVASVAEFGLFVEINDPFVEGLVRAETLGDNWKLDVERHRLVFSGGNRSFGVGEACEIEIASSDPLTRRIDLRLVEHGKAIDLSGGIIAERPRKKAFPAKPTGARPPAKGKSGGKPSGGKSGGGKSGGGKSGGGKSAGSKPKSGGSKPKRQRKK